MPRRTTMPVWTMPTQGPNGPRTVEEVLRINEHALPWADLLDSVVIARSYQVEVLMQWEHSREIALSLVRPGGAVMAWLDDAVEQAHSELANDEGLVIALRAYIERLLDPHDTSMAPSVDGRERKS